MRRFVSSVGIVMAALAALAPGAGAAQVGARIWVDNQPDYFRRGDRMNVNFSVSDDSYAAVVHIDTDGNLDFVYPSTPWDNEFVRGGALHRISARGTSGAWTVRGSAGIGYFYLIASPNPLDFTAFRGRTGTPWQWGYAGQVVRGDPFLALDQIARILLPYAAYPRYVADYYSYYVDGIHPYPSYACSNQYPNQYLNQYPGNYPGTYSNQYAYSNQVYGAGWGMNPMYGSCAGQDYFLRDYPYYYDTRLYRGNRRQYLGQYDSLDPRHGFKASPDQPAQGIQPSDARPSLQGSRGQIPRREPAGSPPAAQPSAQPQAQPQSRPAARGRPATQAEPRSTQPPTAQSPPSARERPSPTGSRPPAPADDGASSRPASGGSSAPARGRPAP